MYNAPLISLLLVRHSLFELRAVEKNLRSVRACSYLHMCPLGAYSQDLKMNGVPPGLSASTSLETYRTEFLCFSVLLSPYLVLLRSRSRICCQALAVCETLRSHLDIRFFRDTIQAREECFIRERSAQTPACCETAARSFTSTTCGGHWGQWT